MTPQKKSRGKQDQEKNREKKMTIEETEGEIIETEKLIPYLGAYARLVALME